MVDGVVDGILQKATVRFVDDLRYPRHPKKLRDGTAKDSRSRRKVAEALTRFGFDQRYRDNPNLLRKSCYIDGCYVYVDIGQEHWRGMEKMPAVTMSLSKALDERLGKHRTLFIQQIFRQLAKYDIPLIYVYGKGEIVIKSWERQSDQ